MPDELETRRRAPGWVRAFSDRSLHGLAGKLQRDARYGDGLSRQQEWLLEVAINELEFRARRDRRAGIRSCTCEFCFGPFELFPIDDPL